MLLTLYVVAMSNSQCINRGRACIVVNRDNYSEYYMCVHVVWQVTLSVKQLQPVMAELKEAKLFKQHKRLLMNSYRKLCRYIAELSIEPFESYRTHMIGLFKEFDELFDSVIDILVELQRDELMTPLLDYFKDEEAEYMHYIRVLDSAVVNLGRSVPPVWESFQGSIKPDPIASLSEQFTVSESKITYVLQKEQSCMDSVHIQNCTSSPEVVQILQPTLTS